MVCRFIPRVSAAEPGEGDDGDAGAARLALQAARPLDGAELQNQLQLHDGGASAEGVPTPADQHCVAHHPGPQHASGDHGQVVEARQVRSEPAQRALPRRCVSCRQREDWGKIWWKNRAPKSSKWVIFLRSSALVHLCLVAHVSTMHLMYSVSVASSQPWSRSLRRCAVAVT